jgi:hypothetical protein
MKKAQNIKSPKIEKTQNAKTQKNKLNHKITFFLKSKNPNMKKMGFNIYPCLNMEQLKLPTCAQKRMCHFCPFLLIWG